MEFCLLSCVVEGIEAWNIYKNVRLLLNHSNMVGILISETALCLKKYHKNERHLCLVVHLLSKLSQNVCLINTQIFMHCYFDITACYVAPIDFIAFFGCFNQVNFGAVH